MNWLPEMLEMQSHMAKEIAEIPDVIEKQLEKGLNLYIAEGKRIAEMNPPFLVTCARGSSDFAAMFLKYMVEIGLGLPVASMGPSVASIYNSSLRLDRSVCIAVSQSGASPDLVKLQEAASRGGATTVSILNTPAVAGRQGFEFCLAGIRRARDRNRGHEVVCRKPCCDLRTVCRHVRRPGT